MLKPRDILDGYEIIRPIGSGGFGEVWLCRSEAIGDYRAIKFLSASNPKLLEKELDALTRYLPTANPIHKKRSQRNPVKSRNFTITHITKMSVTDPASRS